MTFGSIKASFSSGGEDFKADQMWVASGSAALPQFWHQSGAFSLALVSDQGLMRLLHFWSNWLLDKNIIFSSWQYLFKKSHTELVMTFLCVTKSINSFAKGRVKTELDIKFVCNCHQKQTIKRQKQNDETSLRRHIDCKISFTPAEEQNIEAIAIN